MPRIDELPPELISQILRHISTIKDLTNCALTCRTIATAVAKDGYRIFVHTRFPFSHTLAANHSDNSSFKFWRDAAHSLTTLHRNFDRKALLARDVGPRQSRERPAREHSRQTMGFTPVIDSFEIFSGDAWCSRRRIVTWGAGAQLVYGGNDLTSSFSGLTPQPAVSNDGAMGWTMYREEGTVEGRDDISIVKLLQGEGAQSQEIVLGRTSGDLAKLAFESERRRFQRQNTFETRNRPVRAADTNSRGVMAAGLSEASLALYLTRSPDRKIDPLVSEDHLDTTRHSQIWATRFLNDNQLVVGLGPSTEPIRIIDITQGLGRSVIQKIRKPPMPLKSNRKGDLCPLSIYCINSLPASSVAGHGICMSGGHDSIVRLHDFRCENTVVAKYEDSVDFAAIYSLISFSDTKVVAGGGTHNLIKLFDLRLPGAGSQYHADVQVCASDSCGDVSDRQSLASNPDKHPSQMGNSAWNVFLNRGDNSRSSNTRSRPQGSSSVYSLSRPSEFSPVFYAGLEDRVVQVDLTSIMDRFPDPIYGLPRKNTWSERSLRRTWDPDRQVICLPGYRHPIGNEAVRLLVQRPVGLYPRYLAGLDERWSEQ